MCTFRIVSVSVLAILLVVGCASSPDDGDMIKDMVCEVNPDGVGYSGIPKQEAVNAMVIAIELGAGEFGQDISHEEAVQIATEVLSAYCGGDIEGFLPELETQLRMAGHTRKMAVSVRTKLKNGLE